MSPAQKRVHVAGETVRAVAIPGSFWVKVTLAFGLAGAACVVVPRAAEGGGATPPIGTLLLAGTVVAAVTTAALYFTLRRDLGFPAAVAVYAVGYNALVVLVKFVLAPHGLYEVNQTEDLTSLFPIADAFGAAMAAAFVFALYGAVYVGLYFLVRRRLQPPAPRARRRRELSARSLVLIVLAGALLFAGSGVVLVVLIVPLLFVESGIEYVGFVLSSGVSLVVALALAAATWLAVLAFRSTGERARALGDAAVLVSLFWVGLAFLALYHVLWVVYVLVLTSLWPLRVVVPK